MFKCVLFSRFGEMIFDPTMFIVLFCVTNNISNWGSGS